MNKVFVTSNISREGIKLLEDEFELEFYEHLGKQISEEELVEAAKNSDALVTILSDPVTERVIAAGNKLKIVANCGAGIDNIDVEACREKGITVTNTPGVLHKTTADLTFAMILGISRRITEAEKFLRAGNFAGWKPDLLLGSDIHGKKLGIIGMGEIGKTVAKRAQGFEMEVSYYKRTPLSTQEEKELNCQYAEFDTLIKNSDYISLHVPLTKETHYMIDDREFDLMKDSAYLINSARGPVVNESALVSALEEKKIAGAALDVFEEEPKVHSGLLEREDCLLLPHIGSASRECRDSMAVLTCENVRNVLKGDEPKTPV